MKTRFLVMATVVSAGLSAFSAKESRLPDFTWENSDPEKYAVQHIKLEGLAPGMRAELEMWVDAADLTNGTPEASLAWGNRAGKSWAGGSGGTVYRWGHKNIPKDAAGRRKFTIRTGTIPHDAVGFNLYFFAKKPAVGQIRYTDIRMKTYERTYSMFVASSAYRDEAFDGEVRFLASYITDPNIEPPEKLSGTFVFKGKKGEIVRRAASLVDSVCAECTIPVEDFAYGEQDVAFELAFENGKILETSVLRFGRLRKPSARKTVFDADQRMLIDGKPFFPIGMYWSENTLKKPNALERYTAPGVFNALQTYEKAMTPEILDLYHSKGLKVMASVKDIYIPEPDGSPVAFCPPSVKTKEQETKYVTEVVERCRNHPALLAWYTCDEMKGRYAGRLADRYRLLKRLDPNHPVFVLAFTDAIRSFVPALDIGGGDPYPVCSPWGGDKKRMNERPDEGSVWEAGKNAVEERDAMFGLKPQWQVPQAFMWAWDYGGEEKRPELRFPTRLELSSMTWQQIAAGANGIFFYSYGQMLNQCRNDSQLHRYFSEVTVPVARELKEMYGILVLKPGPAVRNAPEKTMVRTWRDGDGIVYVLVCNTHPEFRDGEIEIPGEWAKCEPVFGHRLPFKDGRLEAKMAPMGVSIVELTAR